MPVVRVSLNHDEEVLAHKTGFDRATALNSTANHNSRKDKHLNYHDYITQLSEAVGSEIAVAKFMDIADFQPTINTFKKTADVASKIEVKWTKWPEGHLVIHPSDRNDDIAILVVGKSPEYYLAGWIPIEHAKASQFFVSSERTWWVGQRHLRPMDTFFGSIYDNAAI
jgi:hypothetical protein